MALTPPLGFSSRLSHFSSLRHYRTMWPNAIPQQSAASSLARFSFCLMNDTCPSWHRRLSDIDFSQLERFFNHVRIIIECSLCSSSAHGHRCIPAFTRRDKTHAHKLALRYTKGMLIFLNTLRRCLNLKFLTPVFP